MKNVLVTGGAGFIGSNFIRFFLNARPDVTVVNYDKLTYAGNLESVADIIDHDRHKFVKGDICNPKELRETFRHYSIDTVIHFAAESHVDRSILGSAVFVQTNVIGTHILLETARELGVERFLHISTDEVYGSLGSTGKFSEATPLHPNSPYAATKASSDMFVLAYHRTYGLPTVITRCSNNYGPFQFPEKLIPLMIINALQDKPLPVYGDGLNVRDWVYVVDHCAAIDAVLERGRVGEVYNIGGNNEWKNIDIVRLILAAVGKPDKLITFVKDRPGHDKRYAINATKVMNELGWAPSHSFEDGLRETVTWYVNNHPWWQHVISGEYQEYYRVMYEER
jgi:dTDP-glucose 4,6-dehydratase